MEHRTPPFQASKQNIKQTMPDILKNKIHKLTYLDSVGGSQDIIDLEKQSLFEGSRKRGFKNIFSEGRYYIYLRDFLNGLFSSLLFLLPSSFFLLFPSSRPLSLPFFLFLSFFLINLSFSFLFAFKFWLRASEHRQLLMLETNFSHSFKNFPTSDTDSINVWKCKDC